MPFQMILLYFVLIFQTRYPNLIKNLINNKHRLSTPFDLHETLQSVLNIYKAEKVVKYTDRGISLLNIIPVNRTCQSAGIEIHWCTCLENEVRNTHIHTHTHTHTRVHGRIHALHCVILVCQPNNPLLLKDHIYSGEKYNLL